MNGIIKTIATFLMMTGFLLAQSRTENTTLVLNDSLGIEIGRANSAEEFTKLIDSITFKTQHKFICLKEYAKDGTLVFHKDYLRRKRLIKKEKVELKK